MQELDGPQFPIFGQRLHQHRAKRLGLRGAPDIPAGSLGAGSARRRTWISGRFSISIIISLVRGRISDDSLTR
jgi:hypothetical protein